MRPAGTFRVVTMAAGVANFCMVLLLGGGRAIVRRAVSDEGKATLRSKFRQALHCVKTLFPQVSYRISLQWF
ncbi:hypothetical protein, partial [Streptomyces tanashiensis]|uniref:hypothetical protein n=1 Tax=Streptomyces tanashiensis TaxID=67367 RepID=UPI00342D60B8